jgi:hypothetical protein
MTWWRSGERQRRSLKAANASRVSCARLIFGGEPLTQLLSIHGKLLTLPDHNEVFPAHFSGSACGKGLSGKPASTIGFERRFNPALQFASKAEFVHHVLADLPPQPETFAENRRHNLGQA